MIIDFFCKIFDSKETNTTKKFCAMKIADYQTETIKQLSVKNRIFDTKSILPEYTRL